MNCSVSICMITYNHENYIARAIESVLIQNVKFDYEIIIGEDCSTDRTREIVLDYKTKYPDKINLLLHENNIGFISNFINSLKTCTGKYTAICEGDDYWTDPYKLQKQVEFLEANPGYSMTAHRVAIYDDELKLIKRVSKKNKSTLTIKDVIPGTSLPTLSVVFRTAFINNLPDMIFNIMAPDLLLKIHLSAVGNIFFFNEVMGVYRHHSGGITKKNLLDWKYKELQTNILLREYYPQYLSLFDKKLLTLKNANGLKKESKEIINNYSFLRSLLFQYKVIKSTIYYFLSGKKLLNI